MADRRRLPLRLATLLCGAAVTLSAPRVVHAADPDPVADNVDAHGEQASESAPAPRGVGVEIGGVTGFSSAPIGAGFGMRVGLAYAGWYLGGNVTAYTGGSDVNLSDRALLYGLDLGYGIRLRGLGRDGSIVLRPQVGLGSAAISHTTTTTGVDVVTSASGSSSSGSTSQTVTVSNVYVQPTLAAALQFDRWSFARPFVSASANMLILPGVSDGATFAATTWLSYGMRAEVGLIF